MSDTALEARKLEESKTHRDPALMELIAYSPVEGDR